MLTRGDNLHFPLADLVVAGVFSTLGILAGVSTPPPAAFVLSLLLVDIAGLQLNSNRKKTAFFDGG